MDHVVVEDRISELPWEILDNILGRLPSENAVATTILSRKWKDKWLDVSNLVFDDNSWKGYYRTSTLDKESFVRLVYDVLLSHRGTINKFTLASHYSYPSVPEHDVNLWISFLNRNNIKELTFYFTSIYKLPASLFSCKQLRHLRLTFCQVSMPQNFLGIKTLVSLHLTDCRCTDETLEKMINCSSYLEKLVLTNVGFRRLTICVPTLKYLSLEGNFEDISLENSPLLHDASFKMTDNEAGMYDGFVRHQDWKDILQGISFNSVPPPDWLCRVRRLVMTGRFLKFLAKRCNWHGASIDCHNLEVLELDTLHFDDSDEMAVALSIFRCSSNLNILIIDGVGTYKRDIYRCAEAFNEGKCCFNKLRLVRITILRTYGVDIDDYCNDVFAGNETKDMSFMAIIRLLLAGSPVLKNMHIRYIYLEKCSLWFKRMLLMCERASSQLKLTHECTESDYWDYALG